MASRSHKPDRGILDAQLRSRNPDRGILASGVAGLAADLARSWKPQSLNHYGGPAGSRLDHEFEILIIQGGCACSGLDQELQISLIWGLHWQLNGSGVWNLNGEAALAADLMRCLEFQ